MGICRCGERNAARGARILFRASTAKTRNTRYGAGQEYIMSVVWIETEIHEEIRQADPETLPENVSEYVAQMRQRLNGLNAKLGKLETSTEKSGNVHPERYTVKKRGKDVFICRSDEARAALKGGGDVNPEDLGFDS